jgi:hypothetical protein
VRANWLLKLSFEQALILTKEGPQRHIESVIGGTQQISQNPVPISAFIMLNIQEWIHSSSAQVHIRDFYAIGRTHRDQSSFVDRTFKCIQSFPMER